MLGQGRFHQDSLFVFFTVATTWGREKGNSPLPLLSP